MKRIIKSKEMLLIIRNISLVVLIIAAGFIAFNARLIGISLVLISLFCEWRFYRCPTCNKALDPRINIDKNPYCPHCGEKI